MTEKKGSNNNNSNYMKEKKGSNNDNNMTRKGK